MSGIVGILNYDQSPVDRAMLEQLTGALAFRGPDAQNCWSQGPVGFGHTLLRTAPESDHETQPLTLDGNSWIVADARVDGRQDLIAKLASHGQQISPQAPDVELILRAYHLWGEQCVHHLIGDFVFAIWNSKTRRLFCARDQMGVKPFFYSQIGSCLIFSNTLNCVRRHPVVSSELNELSIADFLLFDMIQDPAATSFASIRRLPPAHLLMCQDGRVALNRYWTFSPPALLRYRRCSDYVDHFRTLLGQAVADRLRTRSACIFMSGGLDSSAVAASAKQAASRAGDDGKIWAFTQVFEKLIPHDEKYFAGLVAQALNLPIQYQNDDHLRLFQFADRPTPEPVHLAWPDATANHLTTVLSQSRVVLTGFGADPLLAARITVHFRQLLARGRFLKAAADAFHYFSREGRLSRLYLKTRLRILFARPEDDLGCFPEWLNDDLVRRHDLRNRWRMPLRQPNLPDCVRPEACQLTFAPFWPDLFGSFDAGTTSVPVDVRFPFFDLRLVSFLLALPRLPWCCDKELLRESAKGILPDEVRLRRKTPLRADPLLQLLKRDGAQAIDAINGFEPAPALEQFVNSQRIPPVNHLTPQLPAWVHLRPLSLNYWLRRESRAPGLKAEAKENHIGTMQHSPTMEADRKFGAQPALKI